MLRQTKINQLSFSTLCDEKNEFIQRSYFVISDLIVISYNTNSMPEFETVISHEEEASGKIKYIVFDVDGVLVNTISAFSEQVPEFANQVLIPTMGAPTREQVIAYEKSLGAWGFPPTYTIEVLGQPVMIDRAQIIADFFDKYLATVKGSPFTEVREVLDSFQKQQFRMSASSSHTEARIKRRLKGVQLIDYFDHLVGNDPRHPEITKGEPHFRILAQKYGEPYEKFVRKLVFVDDGPRNIELAAATGALVIGRRGTTPHERLMKAGAVCTIQSLTELPQIITSYNKNVRKL